MPPTPAVTVRPLGPADHAAWLRMRVALWPDSAGDDGGAADAAEWLARPDAAVLVAVRPDGGACGFVEVGERSYAEGCESSPVAYLEGWWVDPDARRRGVGAALVRAAEAWARERGHRELASDTTLDNVGSQRAHLALGFVEVERGVHYHRALAATPGGAPPGSAAPRDATAPVTYEITATVAAERAAAYERYMRERHVPDLLATGCFVGASIARAEAGDEGAARYRIRYEAPHAAALARYLAEHAARLRADFAAHFPEGVTIERTVWHRLVTLAPPVRSMP